MQINACYVGFLEFSQMWQFQKPDRAQKIWFRVKYWSLPVCLVCVLVYEGCLCGIKFYIHVQYFACKKNKENNVMLALITNHYVQLTHNSLRSLRENFYISWIFIGQNDIKRRNLANWIDLYWYQDKCFFLGHTKANQVYPDQAAPVKAV